MKLNQLYNDKDSLREIHTFLISYLTEEAVKRVFDDIDVAGVREARKIIDEAFESLDTLFGPKEKKTIIDPR